MFDHALFDLILLEEDPYPRLLHAHHGTRLPVPVEHLKTLIVLAHYALVTPQVHPDPVDQALHQINYIL